MCPVILSTRSVYSQVSTTRPVHFSSDARRLVPQAPPVRTEYHYYQTAVDSPPTFLASDQREETDFGSSDSEDESEYPVGYYDDSSDDADEECEDVDSHVPFGSEQELPVDAGFYGEPYGGVLEPPLGDDFLPQTDLSITNYSIVHDSGELHSEAELDDEVLDDSYTPAVSNVTC
ncbi:hypothetical protein CYMTET_33862 [Cymbomonas tetramitiformis]|uniref:Uncharacterized protein n=1 Tax=Cymbomonas tetramitiformis TaxID=36881 RepID=A0AAE0FCG4_9CHLO|nr:hypothetical protein CYMTET_33862 [Cymbomonas tetramitiformis]